MAADRRTAHMAAMAADRRTAHVEKREVPQSKFPHMEKMVEVLPQQLFWAPGLHSLSHDKHGLLVNALELASSDGTVAQYEVEHYEVAKYKAFGPLSLTQTLRFCRRLTAHLAQQSGGQMPIFLSTPPGDVKAHMNVSALLGAFLVLCRQWSAKHVAKVLGEEEGYRMYPSAWSRTPEGTMPVMSCWEGLEMAQQHGWIDANCTQDDILTDIVCSKYNHMVTTYDASWIIPGKILVSADPVTTKCDPNPATFTELWPPQEENAARISPARSKKQPALDISFSSLTTASTSPLQGKVFTASTLPLWDGESSAGTDVGGNVMLGGITSEEHDDDGASSVDTVCKDYTMDPRAVNAETAADLDDMFSSNKSFVQFLQDRRVNMVIRTNYPDEQGMPGYSYDGNKLRQYGIRHHNFQLVDRDGGLPTSSCVAELLNACGDTLAAHDEFGSATLIHCKGGFGRSIILACCLAIHAYDVPGHAMIGWVRMARPGALTTHLQEEFLRSLQGRADVLRFAQGQLEEDSPKIGSHSHRAMALAKGMINKYACRQKKAESNSQDRTGGNILGSLRSLVASI
jgi:hypothetical protein